MLLSSLGIAMSVVNLVLQSMSYKVQVDSGAVEKALKGILTISTVLVRPWP